MPGIIKIPTEKVANGRSALRGAIYISKVNAKGRYGESSPERGDLRCTCLENALLSQRFSGTEALSIKAMHV